MPSSEIASATPVLRLDEIDSTNAEGLRRAAAGERGPLWITAKHQTAGRGRSGRGWRHVTGNLAATLLFDPGCQPSSLHQLSLIAGVATHDAIVDITGGPLSGLRLKWPNDVMIGGAKAGGILVETSSWAGHTAAVIGIGVNIVQAPEIAARAVGRISAHASDADEEALLAALDRSLRTWLGRWQGGRDFAAIRSAWLARAGAIGEHLLVNAGDCRVEGSFAGIDDAGALLLRDREGIVQRLTYGDVSLGPGAGTSDERT